MSSPRPLFTLAAFAVIFDERGQVLLCHRRDMDAWNLPGGGLEPGELPGECVVREVREETGLETAVEGLVGVYGKHRRSELIFAFLCRVTGGALRLTSESDANQYFPPEALPANTLHMHAERIADALRARQDGWQPVFRRQGSPRT